MALVVILLFRPYKKDLFNIFDAFIFANLATLSGLSLYNFHVTITEAHTDLWAFILQYILIFAPLLSFVYIVWIKCWSKMNKLMHLQMTVGGMKRLNLLYMMMKISSYCKKITQTMVVLSQKPWWECPSNHTL